MIHSTLVCLLVAVLSDSAPGLPEGLVEIPDALVEPIEQVDVAAGETGLLAAVKVQEGDMVREGDLLAQIVDDEARIAEQRAKLELDIARKNAENDIKIRFAKKSVEVAKAELRRSELSVQKYPKSISDSEMDRLRLLVEKGTLEIEQAEREFEIAAYTEHVKENEYQSEQANVKRRRIVSPLSGMVVQVSRHRGEWVKPGETVLHILRLDRLRAVGFLKAAYAIHNLQNHVVRMRVEVPGTEIVELPGRVIFLDPELDPVNTQIRIWVEIENKALQLRPGMRGKMTIEARPVP